MPCVWRRRSYFVESVFKGGFGHGRELEPLRRMPVGYQTGRFFLLLFFFYFFGLTLTLTYYHPSLLFLFHIPAPSPLCHPAPTNHCLGQSTTVYHFPHPPSPSAPSYLPLHTPAHRKCAQVLLLLGTAVVSTSSLWQDASQVSRFKQREQV